MFSDQYDTSDSVIGYVSTVVTLVGVVWGIWTAAWHLNFNRSTKNLGSICQDDDVMGDFVANVPSEWWRIFPFLLRRTQTPRLPSVTALIYAGEDGIYTSSIFNAMPLNWQTLSWKPIYENFFLEYAWALYGPLSSGITEIPRDNTSEYGYLRGFQRKAQEKVRTLIRSAGGKNTGLVRQLYQRYWRQFPTATTSGISISPDQIPELDRHLLYFAWNIQDVNENRRFRGKETLLQALLSKLLVAWKTAKKAAWTCVMDEEMYKSSRKISPILIKSHLELNPPYNCRIANIMQDFEWEFHGIRRDISHSMPNEYYAVVSRTWRQPWSLNHQRLWIYKEKPCVEVSKDELAALALIMGFTLGRDYSYLRKGPSPYPASLGLTTNEGIVKLKFTYSSSRTQLWVGSGYSIRFAKYMACGYLPFAYEPARPIEVDGFTYRIGQIHAIDVSRQILDAIKQGRAMSRSGNRPIGAPASSKRLEVFRPLPSAANTVYLYSDTPEVGEKGKIYRLNSRSPTTCQEAIVGSWVEVVTRIAFGGLVPVATKPLIDAVAFTVGGSIQLNEMEILEGLASHMHMSTKDEVGHGFCLFGQFQEEMSKLVYMEDISMQEWCKSLLDLQEIFDVVWVLLRYNTLLERLIAITDYSFPFSRDSVGDLEERKRNEVFHKSIDVINTSYNAACMKESLREKAMRTNEVQGTNKTKGADEVRGVVDEGEIQKTCEAKGSDEENRKDLLKELAEKINQKKLQAEDCAIIVRYIIKAWVYFVQVANWNEDEAEEIQGGLWESKNKRVSMIMEPLADLPDVALWE